MPGMRYSMLADKQVKSPTTHLYIPSEVCCLFGGLVTVAPPILSDTGSFERPKLRSLDAVGGT